MNEKKYFELKLNEIPKEVLQKSVDHLKTIMSDNEKQDICNFIDQYGLHDWIHKIDEHFGYGMYIRNQLRQAGLTDNLLPDQNWDDYYVSVIEIAIGKRPNP